MRAKENMMRALPLSLCCLAGAVVAGAGVIADSLDSSKRYDMAVFGGIIVVLAFVLTVIATFVGRRDH